MALPAFDDFDRANGGLGANWTTVDTAPTIVSNECAGGDAGGSSLAYWSADAFNADQYGQVVVGTGGNPNGSPATRLAATRGYLLSANTANVHLYRLDGNESFALLQSNSGTGVVVTDVLRLESEGSTHRVYKNAVQQGTNQTDGTYASGSAGVFLFGSFSRLDDWEGGNIGGGGVTGSPWYYYAQQ
jgi:hypothetical protein